MANNNTVCVIDTILPTPLVNRMSMETAEKASREIERMLPTRHRGSPLNAPISFRKGKDPQKLANVKAALPMGVDDFAEKHRLVVSCDRAETPIIRGRTGLIHEWDRGRLAVYYALDFGTPKNWSRWEKARRSCEAVGMEVILDRIVEGVCAFDPLDEDQARTAIAVAGCEARSALRTVVKCDPHLGQVFSSLADHTSYPAEEMPLAA